MRSSLLASLFVACSWISAYAQEAEKPSALPVVQRRLAEVLDPGTSLPTLGIRKAPIPWARSALVEDPAAPVPVYQGTPLKVWPRSRKEFVPRMASAWAPLAEYLQTGPLPVEVQLPVTPLIRLIAVNSQETPPLPIFAQPTADRASLGDPTVEASQAAATPSYAPSRSQPVPFAPINLPDPFENERAGRLRNPPEESPMPVVLPVKFAK